MTRLEARDSRSTATAEPGSRHVRVMHLVYALGSGGMEHGVVKLVNGLAGSAIESSVCSTAPADPEMKRSLSAPLFELTRRNGNDPWLVARLVRLLKRERPDVLHTHAWGTLCEGVAAARLAGIRRVVHGEHGTLETRTHNVALQRWVWGRSDCVLSVSSRLADRMAATIGFPRDRIRVIPNGVDTRRFHPGGRHDARRILNLNDEDLVFGTVGRLVPVKGQLAFVEALARLRAGGIRCTGVIAGDGPLQESLAARAAALGLDAAFRLLGHRTDVERTLAALDVFVLPSLSEGLSNTILEAMATGLPVIATRVGGADEMVADPSTGLLVDSGDTEALAGAMTALARDAAGRQLAGAAARRRVETCFSMERMLSGYADMYLDVARSRDVDDDTRGAAGAVAAHGGPAAP